MLYRFSNFFSRSVGLDQILGTISWLGTDQTGIDSARMKLEGDSLSKGTAHEVIHVFVRA